MKKKKLYSGDFYCIKSIKNKLTLNKLYYLECDFEERY